MPFCVPLSVGGYPIPINILKNREVLICEKERQLLGSRIMATGTVKWFNTTKGFGFIEPDEGGKDAFVHISAVERSGLTGLSDGQKVDYEMEPDRQGRLAVSSLKLIDG